MVMVGGVDDADDNGCFRLLRFSTSLYVRKSLYPFNFSL